MASLVAFSPRVHTTAANSRFRVTRQVSTAISGPMGSFDSSNAAGFMTQSILSQRLTTIFNGIPVGSFVEFSPNELTTLAVFQPLATDNGPRTPDNQKCRDRRQRCRPFAAYSM